MIYNFRPPWARVGLVPTDGSAVSEAVSRKASTLTLADVNLIDVDGVASEPQVVNAAISE